MSTLRLFLLITFTILYLPALYSQIQNTWVGGTPGREKDWNCHKNWSKQKVPNEFNDVVIPDTRSSTFVYPVIDKGNVIINSLKMHPGTILYIQENVNFKVLMEHDTIPEVAQSHQNKGVIKFNGANFDQTIPANFSRKYNLQMSAFNSRSLELKH